ncbi:radical SAM protein [Pseudophaeobacter leonis]|uniref:radical SAM protein n=1 Tax=Pseudophaeobacter leonis TaxID=1144477 RepID=UPI0009F28B03|nr:radical SAM protein [Pseudophaeobacter leonis]
MCQKSQLAKLGLFDAKVPRYTSYPTVANFNPTIGSGHFMSWIRAIPPGNQISLYLHVPFCRNLCWFCMCRTQGARSDAPIAAYIDALKQEIMSLKLHLPKGVTLSRLHWGGGTPTILSPEMIREVTAALADLAPLSPGAEFSVEIDPNAFDLARCEALIRAGMTHASIGVQGVDSTTQQAIGRSLDFARVQTIAEMLRRGGVQCLSMDLLYGLPHQTQAQMSQSIQSVLSLAPDRLTLYAYIHLPALIRRQAMIPSEALPRPEDRLDLFETARALCLQEGYQAIGIDTFARPNDGLTQARSLKRGFQGYSNDPSEVLIGLGASAISRFPQGYAQNAPGTARYITSIGSGSLATDRGHAFQGEDRLRGRMIEALLCTFKIPRHEIMQRFPDQEARFNALVSDACKAFPEILALTEEGAVLPEPARALARVIARHFDAYVVS